MTSFDAVAEVLLRSSLQGALFIAAVWLACRLFPRLPAAVRCGLWWAACLKLLVGLIWISPVEVPLLPAALTSPALLSRPLPSHLPGRGGRTAIDQAAFKAPSLPGRWEGRGRERGGWGSEGSGRRNRIEPGGASGVATIALVFLWLAGLAWQAAKALRQLRYTRWVIARSWPLREAGIRTAFAEVCALLGLRRQPDLRGSREVRTPQAIGPLRPLVLLPDPGLERLSPAEVSMTLCHELVHLRRGDLWLGWVPALAHRIFFFHPLAALAAREYAIAREAACDAEVLRVLGSAPQAYGRLLLRWGVAPRETGLAAAGASPSPQNLKRRLQMLQQTSELIPKSERRLSGWWWLAGAAVLAVGLIPLRIVAQEPAPEVQPEAAPVVAEAPEAPAVVTAEPVEAPAALAEGIPGGVEGGVIGGVLGGVDGGVVGGVEGGVEGGVQGGVVGGVKGGVEGGVIGGVRGALPPSPGPAPTAAAIPSGRPSAALPSVAPVSGGAAPAPLALAGTPLPAAAPRPGALPATVAAGPAIASVAPRAPAVAALPASPAPPADPKKGYGYSFRSGDHGDSWVLLYGDNSATMSGSLSSLERVKRLRGESKESILWYRHDGKEYVVRDPAVVKQAREIFRPQMDLGARQGELGARQGALGAQQGQLGARQGELGGRQGALGAQMAALAAERIAREGEDDRTLEERESKLEAQMEELGRQQEELGRQQEALGRQQEALGRQQEGLGRQQKALGRQQKAVGEKAERELRALMDQAIRSGAAREVK